MTAFHAFYTIFRTLGIEGILQFMMLSILLCYLCPMKYTKVKSGLYVLISTATFAAILLTLKFIFRFGMPNILGVTELPYWVNVLSIIVLSVLYSHFLLNNTFMFKLTYILFYVAFVMLFKIVCSPLYELEQLMSRELYEVIDIFFIFLLLILLALLVMFFHKNQLLSSIHITNRAIAYTMYFPISIIICYTLTTNSPALHKYTNPLTALVMLTNLPMIYYILYTIVNSYEEQKKMDMALTETRAQLARFRFSIELQDQLKKERHELKNNYFYIQTLLKEKKYEQLDDYMENVVGEKLQSLNEIQTGNMLMDYILNKKVAEAHKHHIKTYVEVLVPDQLNVSEDTICTILLNLLDNAIEASCHETDPDIHISINCAQNYLVAKIRNKTADNVLISNPGLSTTKSDKANHGLGMKIIRHAVHKANGIFDVSNSEGYFTATVMLPMV